MALPPLNVRVADGGTTGAVTVAVTVEPDGRMSRVEAITGTESLYAAAEDTVRSLSVSPQRAMGFPIRTEAICEVRFYQVDISGADAGAPQLVPPKVLHEPPIVFPETAFLAGAEGTVTVAMTVDTAGIPRDVKIISGPQFFHSAALDLARETRFEPGKRFGVPSPMRVSRRYAYDLADVAESHLASIPLVTEDYQTDSIIETPPRILNTIVPVYPEDARRMGFEGDVVVEIAIGVDGKPFFVRAIHGPKVFREEAVRVVYAARFEPATSNGKPVPCRVYQKIMFRLRN